MRQEQWCERGVTLIHLRTSSSNSGADSWPGGTYLYIENYKDKENGQEDCASHVEVPTQ